MEFAAAGWCIEKYLGLDQIKRDLTCGDWETLFLVNQLGPMEWKKMRLLVFQDLFGAESIETYG